MNKSSFGYLNSLKCDAHAYLNRASNRLNTVIVSCLTLISAPHLSEAADIAYTGSGADHQWTNTANWQSSTIPNDSSTGAAFNKESTHVEIATNDSAICKGFMLGMYGKINSAEISGGSLSCNWIDVGRANQQGGSGTLIVSGGAITVSGALNIPTQFSSQSDPNKLGSGQIDLLSGTLAAGSIHIGSGQTGTYGGNGSIYVTDGTLIINGDKTSLIQGYIDAGYITTAADRTLALDYNISTSGKTTLSTTIPPVATNIDHIYDGADGDTLWSNSSNWTNDLVPNHSSNGAAFSKEGTHVLINSVAVCRGFMLGMYGKTNTAEINGGSLTAEWFDIGRCNQNGGNGTLTITNGDVTVNGTINVPTQFSSHVDPNNLGSGHIDLIDGTLTANHLHMGNGQVGQNGGNGSIAITDGTLTLNGDKASELQTYIGAGYITTDSNRIFALDYDLIASGKTTLRSLQANIDYVYTDGGSDTLWSNPNNWQQQFPPSTSDTGAAFWNDGTHVTIDTNAVCRGLMLGMYGATSSAEINGGSLSAEWLDIGRCNQNGGNGTLTITNGDVTVAGVINIPKQFSSHVDPNNLGSGHIDLLDGTLTAQSIHMGNGQVGQNGGNGSITILDGTLTINGDVVTQLQGYIDAGYITTAAERNFTLDYNQTHLGQTTLSSSLIPLTAADSPYPVDIEQDVYGLIELTWNSVPTATSYNVYFGTTATPAFLTTLESGETSFNPGALLPNTTYFWRIDAVRGQDISAGPLWSFTTQDVAGFTSITPPVTDYCAMLSQEIQGKKHGFLAGNSTYYIGGFMPVWNQNEDETIGFTHPFSNDLRSRGFGMVDHPETGYGHDLTGWEFYKHTKIAYGTVIINGTRYEHPVPTAMYWRPDRMICEYTVGGVTISEEKFIGLNDAAATIITSDAPITLEFAGQSFYKDGTSVTTTATCAFDSLNNAVHVVEGGTNYVKPVDGEIYEGVMMYDGMSTIISASKPLQNYTNTTESTGQQLYSFTVPCDANGLTLVWSMHDDAATAVNKTQTLLADPAAELQAKTDYMNDLLNNQVPYFRCSDDDIVQVYYYLWALYMMYYIDLSDAENDYYAHTQTAVNNFLGMHRYDANLQTPVSAWIADKEYYANGNVLIWKSMLPYADLTNGTIPADNLGQAWYSGLNGGITGHVPAAWTIYERSGDIDFLGEAYDFYRALMWNSTPGFWGHQYEAAECLSQMALELGYPQSEADHWDTMVNRDDFDSWINDMWGKSGVTHYFGAGSATGKLGWTTFAYLNMPDFPKDWARDMVETWAMNAVTGFNRQGQMGTQDLLSWQAHVDAGGNPNFMITPDTNYFALTGMYRSGVYDHANTLTLAHLKNYNMKWGVPCAPEAVKYDYEFHGDQYSNFNAGKILLILEGILGMDYSLVGSNFTLAENMPEAWTFMESYVPIEIDGQTEWTYVRVDRSEDQGVITKDLTVQSNAMLTLELEPWLEGKSLLTAPAGYNDQVNPDHIGYQLWGTSDTTLQIQLTE